LNFDFRNNFKAQADFSESLRIDPSEPEKVPVQYRRQGK
jgi:hypothetical protein